MKKKIPSTKKWHQIYSRGGEKTPPPENQLLRNKNTFSLHEVIFCINLAWFWGIALIFSWILMNFGVFGIKMTEKAIFYKNWATCKLFTSKESWNHLEIDFLAKKYDLFKKKIKNEDFLIFWPKNGRIRCLRRTFSQNFY